MVERVFEVDAGINDLIDKVIKWPRSLGLMVAFTVVAAVLYLVERQRGRLLAVEAPPSSVAAGAEPVLV